MHFNLSFFFCFLLSFISCKSQQADIYDLKNFYQIDSIYSEGTIYKRIYLSKLDSSISYSDMYDTKGRMISRLFLKNGKGNGPYYSFYANGVVSERGVLKSGMKEEGEWLSYNEGGKLIEKRFYKNGKEDGEWLTYDSVGTITRKKFFKDGIKVGDWLVFNSAGRIIEKQYYRNGLKDGVWLKYDDEGRLIRKSFYKNDVLLESKYIKPK